MRRRFMSWDQLYGSAADLRDLIALYFPGGP
jgi:hypothetical protein